MSIIDSLNDSWKFDIETSKECQDIEDKLRASFDLQFICPPLPVPATKQQCLGAVQKCKKLFAELTKEYLEYQELVVHARNQQVSFEVSLHQQFLQHSEPTSLDNYHDLKAFKVADAIYEHRQKILELHEDWRSDSVLLQRQLHKLVEGQDEELVEWYFSEVMSEFSSHVKIIKPSHITEATVSTKRGVLPAEIRSLIYSHCDLESCVSLRQVSSEWFLTFQTLERDFKEKLPLRNISIFPGDDFQTWLDCVLVFVARLQKWTSIDSLQTITYPEAKPVKSLLARTSQPGEKVPSNLTALVSSYCRSWDFCPHLHDRLERVRVNLKSFAVEREDREWLESVDGEMIRVQDIDVTLPPSIPASHGLAVKVNSMCIVVQSETHTMVVPLDKPHFEHGFLLENEKPALVRELGEVIVVKQANSLYWELLDLKTKTLVTFNDEYEHLAACYSGAMWFHMGEAECLVPTMYDLQTPGKLYYSQDKIITGVDLLIPFQGSRADGLSQFVVGSRDTVRVADLATAQVTKIRGPPKDPAEFTQTIPGFLDGKFQVKVMENKDVNELYKSRFRMDRNTLEWVDM